MSNRSNCNRTRITEFLLLGFSGSRTLKVLLFFLCIVIYIMSLTVNSMIIGLYLGSRNLRSPMYFFLCHLSVNDIMLSTSVGPNLLSTLLSDGKTMSVSDCVTQYCVSSFFTGNECLLLTVMSYDRFLAICHSLHYVNIMTSRHSHFLVIWSWILVFLSALIVINAISYPGFCGCNTLDYIYCDYAPLLEVSCADKVIVEILKTLVSISLAILPLLFVISSYIRIILAILRISTSTGRQKAFSTCISHLTVVCTYYGILIAKYTVPSKGQSSNVNKMFSFLYTMVTPLLNPIIYSVRNREIQKALGKMIYVMLS
ncbi:hypothetical protein GDO86_007041 [Hymenochirus boettgeri]|uniref:G-protein coupled receptors family 1 profile domain-containing protein n=1 Tax=Hymenochirus boettgeri TaxID=247094 RepID=A0A8T2JG08_9PIPI|nr:hypothetical protein GDO86_007041 [Hymenochirus boettgeri]